LLGGEPTLHPDVLVISGILLDYKEKYSPKTIIALETNGTGDFVEDVLRKLPKKIFIVNTSKGSKEYRHWAFNFAPIDFIWYKLFDFSNGCSVISDCGTGLTPYGYYCCAIAGSIDRIFGFDMGRKTIPEQGDPMFEQLNKFCRLCGHFKIYDMDSRIILSPAWAKAYREYQLKKPKLSLY
jgi:hypothetical protein